MYNSSVVREKEGGIMTYQEMVAFTEEMARTFPRKATSGYEEPPETPTSEDLEKFDAILKESRQSSRKEVNARREAA